MAQSSKPNVDPTMTSVVTHRPPMAARGFVKNLLLEETGNPDYPDMITFPFRPTSFNVDTSVNDDTIDVMGMSHSYESYVNTVNATVSFEIYYNALMMIKDRTFKNPGKSLIKQMSEEIEQQRRYLQALMYPGYTSPGVIEAQQPPCILCLPGVVTIRAKLKSMGEVHQTSGPTGDPIELRLNVTFKEAPMARVTMEDVLMNGMFRTWGK